MVGIDKVVILNPDKTILWSLEIDNLIRNQTETRSVVDGHGCPSMTDRVSVNNDSDKCKTMTTNTFDNFCAAYHVQNYLLD